MKQAMTTEAPVTPLLARLSVRLDVTSEGYDFARVLFNQLNRKDVTASGHSQIL